MPSVSRLPRLAAVAFLAAALACGTDREQAARPPAETTTTTADTTPQAASFQSFAIQSLISLRAGVSLDGWRESHPADVGPDHGVFAGAWCAQSRSTARLPGGAVATRRAFFYLRPPPPDYPSTLSDAEVNPGRDCSLGLIVVSLQAPPAADTIVEGIVREMRAMFGGGAPLTPENPGALSDIAQRWLTDSATVGAGRLIQSSLEEDTLVPSRELYVMAALPVFDTVEQFIEHASRPSQAAWKLRMMQRLAAEIDSASVKKILARIEQTLAWAWRDSTNQNGQFPPPENLADLLPQLVEFLDRPAARLESRRATALLFADLVLQQSRIVVEGDSAAARAVEELNRRGAEIRSEGGDAWYRGVWRDSVRQMAPLGLAREVLFVIRAEAADHDNCYPNMDSLIQAEETFLPTARDNDMIAATHFALAKAYSSTSIPTERESPVRRRLIDHFRAALARDRERRHPLGRLAYYELWRLIAGLRPFVFFFPGCGE